mgnify:CR=1
MIESHLKLIGIFLIVLALAHSVLPKYFNWANELRQISLISRQIMYIHTLFIALMLLLMGLLCLTATDELIKTKLGNQILLGLGIFWAIRLFVQFFGYSSMVWKGKRMESVIHVLASLLWVYLSTVFLFAFTMTFK